MTTNTSPSFGWFNIVGQRIAAWHSRILPPTDGRALIERTLLHRSEQISPLVGRLAGGASEIEIQAMTVIVGLSKQYATRRAGICDLLTIHLADNINPDAGREILSDCFVTWRHYNGDRVWPVGKQVTWLSAEGALRYDLFRHVCRELRTRVEKHNTIPVERMARIKLLERMNALAILAHQIPARGTDSRPYCRAHPIPGLAKRAPWRDMVLTGAGSLRTWLISDILYESCPEQLRMTQLLDDLLRSQSVDVDPSSFRWNEGDEQVLDAIRRQLATSMGLGI